MSIPSSSFRIGSTLNELTVSTIEITSGNSRTTAMIAARSLIVPVEVSNLSTLDVSMWKVTPEELAKLVANGDGAESKALGRAADFSETETLKYPRNVARVHPLKLQKVLGDGVLSGAVLVNVNFSQLEYRPKEGFEQLVQVSDLAAHIKVGPKSSLVWVTRLSNGQPVGDADISVFDTEGTKTWSGKTNAEGFADLPGVKELKLKAPRYDWEYSRAVIVASSSRMKSCK